VLVAPDKFKGTLSAREAAIAIGSGLADAGLDPVEAMPLADGGEGTMEALVRARTGRMQPAEAGDPLGRPVNAAFALIDEGKTAVVEMAQASGLWRVATVERDPVGATTYGTGELIAAAIDAGAREVIVGAGGSATTDGGRGALEALGASFADEKADLGELRRRLHGVRLKVACDVRNPLCGPSGAARAFGPQKGAGPRQVDELDERLSEWAELAKRATGRDPAREPMAGAAGGLAGGLWAFAGAELRPGAALVLDALGFDERMREAFVVVTGEGRLDAQTMSGKTVFEVATRTRQAGVPCYAVVGRDELDAFGKRVLNVEAEAGTRGPGVASPDELRRAAQRIARRLVDQI
jgi:glycerate kinase